MACAILRARVRAGGKGARAPPPPPTATPARVSTAAPASTSATPSSAAVRRSGKATLARFVSTLCFVFTIALLFSSFLYLFFYYSCILDNLFPSLVTHSFDSLTRLHTFTITKSTLEQLPNHITHTQIVTRSLSRSYTHGLSLTRINFIPYGHRKYLFTFQYIH